MITAEDLWLAFHPNQTRDWLTERLEDGFGLYAHPELELSPILIADADARVIGLQTLKIQAMEPSADFDRVKKAFTEYYETKQRVVELART